MLHKTIQQIYEAVGKEMCTAIDIALAKGGTEAVVESYYSVMKKQSTGSHMSNDTLDLRTMVDWCYPDQGVCPATLTQVAMLHATGSSKFGVEKQRAPIHTDSRNRSVYSGRSKVLQRMKKEKAKLPFLLHKSDQ